MKLMQELRQLSPKVHESVMSEKHAELFDKLQNDFGTDDEMTQKIMDWLLGNDEDKDVEPFLYDHFFDEMPYGVKKARAGDPSEWISDHMAAMYRKEMQMEACKSKKKKMVKEEGAARKVFSVQVPANVYDGKYYDYRTARVMVLAANEKEAIDIVNANKDDVVKYLAKRRMSSGRTIIPARNPEKNVFFRNDYFVKPMKVTTRSSDGFELFTKDGLERVRVADGQEVMESADDMNKLNVREVPKGAFRLRYNQLMTAKHARQLTRDEMDELLHLEDILINDRRDR